MSETLTPEDAAERIPEGWSVEGHEITRTFEFDDYLRGVNFAQMIGEIAEARFHHPEVIIRYKEVEVRLTTHDAGGITEKDVEMAEILETER